MNKVAPGWEFNIKSLGQKLGRLLSKAVSKLDTVPYKENNSDILYLTNLFK